MQLPYELLRKNSIFKYDDIFKTDFTEFPKFDSMRLIRTE